MNYWKKMAFALVLVAGLCGGAWAQGRGYGGYGTYGEANRDYQIGYRDGLRTGRADRLRGRSYRVAQYKAYKNGNQAYRSGWARGYNEGYYERR